MYLGVHVSIAGKISDSVARAQKLGCSAMQIFSRNPRAWRAAKLSYEEAQDFKKSVESSGIKVIAVHVPYLINLATPYDVLYKKSIDAYIEDMHETADLGAQYLVTHMGSFKNSTFDEGMDRFIKAINTIFKQTQDIKGIRLLLENTSGSGSWLGYSFEHHKMIFDGVDDKAKLGVCLDTAHLFAAGFDIRKESVFDEVLDQIWSGFGSDALKLIHLNDSVSGCGTHIDRHDHIGKGAIGIKAFKHIVNHPRLKDAAFILETPKDSPRADKVNLDRVRKLIGG